MKVYLCGEISCAEPAERGGYCEEHARQVAERARTRQDAIDLLVTLRVDRDRVFDAALDNDLERLLSLWHAASFAAQSNPSRACAMKVDACIVLASIICVQERAARRGESVADDLSGEARKQHLWECIELAIPVGEDER